MRFLTKFYPFYQYFVNKDILSQFYPLANAKHYLIHHFTKNHYRSTVNKSVRLKMR